MQDLPAQPQASSVDLTSIPAATAGSISKEADIGGIGSPEVGIRDVTGQEVELPKEVSSVGVRVQPTTVAIPQPVAQMGVKPLGQNVPAQPAPAVALPLTDDQIAVGLKASITSSIRWLAEFCMRRLKQIHHSITKQPKKIATP